MKKTAIIVLNYNDSKTVIDYLDLIKDYKSIDRILVVDNCSPDNSYDVLKKYENKKIKVIKTDANKGYAYGNNFGVHFLENNNEYYDYILISNADIDVKDETISKCASFLEKHDEVAIVSPSMYMLDGKKSPLVGWKERKLDSDVRDSSMRLTRKYNRPHVEIYDKSHFKGEFSYVDCVPGSFFMIKYDIFKEVNYLDENTFLYYEEDILGKKIKNLGYKVVVLNKERFTHFESVTINKNVIPYRKYKIMQQSKRYYHKTYNEECQGLGKLNLLKLDYVTLMGKNEIRCNNSKVINRFRRLFKNIKYTGLTLFIVKILLEVFTVLFLPIKLLIRKLRRRKKVCYFSLVTWKWIKQRPHFVALKLTDKYNVVYKNVELFPRYVKDTHKTFQVSDNKVNNKRLKIKPFHIFPEVKKYRFLNGLNFLKLLFYNYDKVIFTQPNQIEYLFLKVLKLNRTKIYYECMDNYIGWEKNPSLYETNESNLISYSRKVFVSSASLKEMLINKYGIEESEVTLIRNGYDGTLFNNYEKFDTNLKKKSIVYIGTIDEWFDIDLIVKYAKKYKDVNFYIIGPVNPSMKKLKKLKMNNVILYGPIEHKMVPAFIESSTAMIMPFKINDIIKFVDPVKVYEYLYFKKPIISSYWKELDQFNDLVYYYKSDDEFEKVVNEALKSGFKNSKKYETIMEESKWDNRLKSYLKDMEE